jgi:hypothetical protein
MTAEDILCPLCGGAVDLDDFTQDEHGLAVHVLCYTLKKQGMRSDPLPPKKASNPRSQSEIRKGRIEILYAAVVFLGANLLRHGKRSARCSFRTIPHACPL